MNSVRTSPATKIFASTVLLSLAFLSPLFLSSCGLFKKGVSTAPIKGIAYKHGDRNEKKIALTFDACTTKNPNRYDDKITKVLVNTKTPATIFISGKWMQEESDHAKYLASMPQFELGNHSYSHPHMTKISDQEIEAELSYTQNVFEKLLGQKPLLFRPPYGEYDQRVMDTAAKLGMRTILYDVASGDPDVHFTKDVLIKYVEDSTKNGSIIIMHINKRGWHTAEALPTIIEDLKKKGYTFVKVSELLN
jgi:peptidoglycan/xylan/chitin deacetylase (PgdA/CDA1 family)